MPKRALTLICRSPRETAALAKLIGRFVHPGSVIALAGPLGTGKTLFASALARSLGIRRPLRSPTFVVASAYPVRLPKINRLYHIDLYRLRRLGGADRAALQECLGQPKSISLVEWANRSPSLVSSAWLRISFAITGTSSRRIRIAGKIPSQLALKLRARRLSASGRPSRYRAD